MLEVSKYWMPSYTKNHSNKTSMALAQKQTQRPMEQNRRARHEPTQLHIWVLTKEPKTDIVEKTGFSTNSAGKTRHPHVKY
jgi:hypothetical protein